MKKLLLMLLLTGAVVLPSFSQTLPRVDRYDLETEEGVIDADSIALPVAEYLFKIPAIKDDPARLRAMSFLNKWMEETPSYEFILDEDIMANFDDDKDITDLYMAALTKYQLQNPDIEDDRKISIGALKLLLDYADNDDNYVLLRDDMNKLMAAYKAGRLEQAL
ncbi:hypothetical protein LJ707_13495 [Mucilaginibacter sp. UR6-1]|uniref:hypothetical protein n=1 Tax=Mucilaginibacter sp. UR6-1 TaxID=1435643 RepID=UPI001E4DC2E1|nr:hypothetical protein [Mucilaginibacter sp. UR6-1]MCC8409947.1 hypothetical protein [Mucilaginibacter sp. UR6-1]